MMKEIINRAKKNPLIVFGWTLFTLCLGYLVNQEISFPDRADYFEKANIEVSVFRMEYDRFVTLLSVYRESNNKILLSIKTANEYIDERFPQITKEDTKHVQAVQLEARRELSKPLVLLRNAYFDNTSFMDLVRVLEADAVYCDAFIFKRIEFLDLILSDFSKAKKMRPSMEIGVDEERKFLEIETREPLIEYILEKARQESNAKLRTAQRKEKLYKLQSKAAIAAWIYIGGFAGAWIGYLVSARRRKNNSQVA